MDREAGGLLSMRSQRIGHNLVTEHTACVHSHTHTHIHTHTYTHAHILFINPISARQSVFSRMVRRGVKSLSSKINTALALLYPT